MAFRSSVSEAPMAAVRPFPLSQEWASTVTFRSSFSGSRGSTMKAPKSPFPTCSEETWWEWYQYVPEKDEREVTVLAHSWESGNGRTAAMGASDTLERKAITPGTPVRLRLINTDSYPVTFSLTGAPFEVAAIDGTDLNAPTELTDTRLELAAGGRYDVTFTMPATPVRLGVPGSV